MLDEPWRPVVAANAAIARHRGSTYADAMRAVMQEVPEGWLEERSRKGLDLLDEMWEGVLHIVPTPSYWHQKIGTQLVAFLEPRLADRGIEVLYETGVHRPGTQGRDYRVPDLVFLPLDRRDLVTERGIEGGPAAVLEIRSPDDETYDKFDFWSELGVQEIIVVEPDTRRVELFRLAGTRYLATSADDRGRLHARSIEVRFSTIDGPRLRVECGDGSRDI
jgi:Uma2 family endonuclease